MCSPGARKASSRPLGLNCEGFPYLSCAPMHKTSPIMRAGKYTSEVWPWLPAEQTMITLRFLSCLMICTISSFDSLYPKGIDNTKMGLVDIIL